MISGDLHIHSCFSFDSYLKPSRIIQTALKKGLNFIAVTDHDTIKGGIETDKVAAGTDLRVIIGAEIKTDKGDIVGLFLQEEINSRKAADVIREIHAQGGLAILPHPFKKRLRYSDSEIASFDAIEINARLPEVDNNKAKTLAEKFSKPLIGASDAHFHWEIGNGLTCVNSDSVNEKSLLESQPRAEIVRNSFVNKYFSYLIGKFKNKQYGTNNGY